MANNRELSQFANTVGYSDGSVGIGTAKPLDPPHASNTKVLSVGIVTANYLYGDGSNLTGVSGGSGISTDAQGNTYAGDYAGGSFSGTSAQYNTLYGYDAGGDITTGDYNTCIGWTAGDRITTGSKNVAVGAEALDNLTTGSQNVGVGWEAGRSLSSGNRNTCIGDMAGRSFGSNNDCIAIGYHAASNFGGNNHVIAIGSNSAFLGGTAKIAIGEQSFQKRTDYCIGIGQYSGRYSEGDYNLFLGYTAGQGGYYNGARGIGSNNIAIGHQVLRGYFGAYDNTIIGTRAGYAMTESHSTVAIGVSALKSATTAANNVAIGALSGDSITTGSNNIFIGRRAGYNVDGNNNTIIGSMEYAASTTMNGQVTIGAGTTELVRINDTGVGIGTDNPETNFQVRKAVQSEIRATENVSGHHVSIYQQAIHSYIIAGRSSGTPTQDLLFYTGGTEKLRITSDGEVKMPSQPMMQVWAVTTGSKSVSGNSATTLIPLNAGNTYDPLSDLNSSTGVYTAPVTGRYLTYYGTEGKTTNNASAGSIYYNINNGGISGQCLYYGDQYSGNSKQVILSLAAGDTVKWQIYGNNNQSYSINAAVYGIHLLG